MNAIFSWFATSQFGAAILRGSAIVIAVLSVLAYVRKTGEDSAHVDSAERAIAAARKAHERQNNIERLPDGAASEQLRRDWTRE